MTILRRLALLVLFCASPASPAGATALDDYVHAPDENYAWRLIASERGTNYNTHVLHMASQVWRTGKDVDRVLWRHWLLLTVPDDARFDTAMLMIGGGDNDYDPPDGPNASLVELARASRSVVAELRMVPNQPLFFLDDPQLRPRHEDAIIAFSWDRFFRTGDPTWIAQLPMTKSAVRAMDTVTEFCSRLPERPLRVNKFVVSGASKRGWTTWLTAAVDRRVVAIAPIVIDMLNAKVSFDHHYRSLGFYAPAVDDYVENHIMDRLETDAAEQLLSIIDPYRYRDRLTMPKLLINSSGDQFFLPDSSRFYFHQLEGPSYLRYVPNTDHGLRDSDARETLYTFYRMVLEDKTPPQPTWRVENDTLYVEPAGKVKQATLWRAHNPRARDFRLMTIKQAWNATELRPVPAGTADDPSTPTSTAANDADATAVPGTFTVRLEAPDKGWRAYCVELAYPDPFRQDETFKLSTEVFIRPERLPYESYQPRPVE